MPLAILIIPSVICVLYGLYRGLMYNSETYENKFKEKRGNRWN